MTRPPHRQATDKVIAIDELRSLVPDGASVFLGGFSLYRAPLGLVRQLARARPRDLIVWSHIGGAGIEMLLAVGAAACVRSSYVGLDILGLAPIFSQVTKTGAVGYVEETEATLMFGMKAHLYRLPFMPARALVGSDIVAVRPDLREYDCQISGERLVAIPPVTADIALLHGHLADRAGNIQLHGTMGNDVEIAKVCSRVIVSVERIAETAELLERPELTRIPSHLVDAVIELPGGAYPSSCLPHYDVDYGYFLDYIAAVEDGDIAGYLATHIDGPVFSDYVRNRVPAASARAGT